MATSTAIRLTPRLGGVIRIRSPRAAARPAAAVGAVAIAVAALVANLGPAESEYSDAEIAFLDGVQETTSLRVVVPQQVPEGYVLVLNAGTDDLNRTSTVQLHFAPETDGLPFVTLCASTSSDIYEACVRDPQSTDRVVGPTDRHDHVLIRSVEPERELPAAWSEVSLVPLHDV